MMGTDKGIRGYSVPIYEYKCKSCDNKFETLRSMRDDSPASCPTCGGEETMRLLSLFAAQTKDSDGAAVMSNGGAAPTRGGGCCGGGCGCACN